MRPASNIQQHDDVSYLITWTYPPDEAALLMIVRVERAEKVMGVSSVYRKVREFRHSVESVDQQQEKYHTYQQPVHSLEPHASYRVRVVARDAHHCDGLVAELYLNSETFE